MSINRHSVMISSTWKELQEHRGAVISAVLGQQMFPVAMETDSAIPDKDLIAASLSKVEEADAYVGLISYRYGQTPVCVERNRKELSLTELEYERAFERGLPRCMFIMHDDHPITRGEMHRESDAAVAKLKDFIARVKQDSIIYAEFRSVDDLKAKVVQTLARLRARLDDENPKKPSPPPEGEGTPAPPAFFAKPHYLPGFPFQGRVKELAALADWARGPEPVMLIDAIGGMGKSMVAWEWIRNHAPAERADATGRFWYSFYERGATMRDFCVTALSYMTRRPRETFRNQPSDLLAEDLLKLLRARPWLLALDGLERVLVAYHRSDAAQVPDEEAGAAPDSNAVATACIKPDDEELLRQLRTAAPSKILVTSRLTPRVWLNQAGQTVPEVRRWPLVGLDARDAEAMLRAAGVRGDGERMRVFLEQKFGCHPLIVGIVGGLVLDHLKSLGNFDRWIEAPDGGAAVDLTDASITVRKTHILKQAFDGLEPLARDLMARLAIISNAVDGEVLEAMNPARPPPPDEVAAPGVLDLEGDFLLRYFRTELAQEKSRKDRADTERRIRERESHLRHEYEAASRAYPQYVEALEAWRNPEAVREAGRKLAAMVRELDRRGLLQCDRHRGEFDLHPVVRGYAVQSLAPETRAETGQHVADYFASRVNSTYETAASLADLQDGIQVVQALNLTEKKEAAWDALSGNLQRALLRLELHHDALALLRPFFPAGWRAPPSGVKETGIVAGEAGLALNLLGRREEANFQELHSVQDDVTKGLSSNLAVSLRNFSNGLQTEVRWAEADRLLSLGRDVAEAVSPDVAFWCEDTIVYRLVSRGSLAEASARWDAIQKRLLAAVKADGQLEAEVLVTRANLLLRTGRLSEDFLRDAIARSQKLHERSVERRLWSLQGRWLQAKEDAAGSEKSLARAIEMAHAVRLTDTESEARRGLSLMWMNRRDEAEAAAASAEHAPPHDALAELYWELGDRDKARHHAVQGYKLYWG